MLDLAGPELQPEEREMLLHPLVGGVILFTRNYHSPEQVAKLTKQVRGLRVPRLLVGVDHEGGRVQRFREGFTRLPACAAIGAEYDKDEQKGLALAAGYGWVMASELAAVGVDFSFAPVLDLGLGVSRVIQDRAYHRDPLIIARLASESVLAMRKRGMVAVGKHFPGHGSVAEDSHYEVPIDSRELGMIEQSDLLPFKHLIQAGLAAIMPAHVVYPKVDEKPAGFSSCWLNTVLRRKLRFDGVVFSDDICMQGAAVAGDHLARVHAALQAGCDVVLVCNDSEAAARVLHGLDYAGRSHARLARMYGQKGADWRELRQDPRWREASARLESCAHAWETRALSERGE
ncbi:MAG: beta-N-acetylhexosaminidase [Gammaproteobacteria bacterium]